AGRAGVLAARRRKAERMVRAAARAAEHRRPWRRSARGGPALGCGARALRGQSTRAVGRVRTILGTMTDTGRADLQLHSDLGDGLASPEAILDAAERAGLDVIALTDHDDIRGSFVIRDIASKRGSKVQVVPGIEVTTRSGHLLALWVEDEIKMLGSLAATVAKIHAMGGVAIAPHPLSFLTFSIGEGALRGLHAGPPE